MRVRDLLRVQEGTVSARRDPVGAPARARIVRRNSPRAAAADWDDLDDLAEFDDLDALEDDALVAESEPAGEPRMSEIARDFLRRQQETERAWRRVVAQGRRRRGRLTQSVEVTQYEPEMPPDETEGPAPPRPTSVPALVREVEALESRANALRRELIARYETAEEVAGEGSPVVEGTPLRRGAVGTPVLKLTSELRRVRSPVTHKPYLDAVNVHFDQKTDEAVRAFQRDHGLAADGVVGPRTSSALSRAYAEARSRSAPERAE